jgi:SOS-response transcriptional repressor LexA
LTSTDCSMKVRAMPTTRVPPNQRLTHMMRAINRYYDENGWTPSNREIGDLTGLSSTATVKYHLDTLVEKGWVERVGSQHRLRITPLGREQ